MNTSDGALFDVVAVAAHGAMRTTRVAAPSAQMAAQKLQLDGWRVLACRPVRSSGLFDSRLISSRHPRLQIGLFAEEFAALLDAGLGMVDAIRTLAEKEKGAQARGVLERVASDLVEGQPLSQAMTNQSASFPAVLIAAVTASEQTGDLVPSLRRYAAHLEMLDALRSKVIGAAIYPALLLAVGCLVVLFLLGVVVPRFDQLLEGAQRDLPIASVLLMRWGKLVSTHPWIFVGTLGAGTVAVVVAIARAMREGWKVPVLQRLWLVGPLVRMFHHAQFYRTSAMLVQGGIPALRAFTMCRSLLAPDDQRGLDRATTAISEGERIGPALASAGIADSVALRMLEVAQRTGRLAEVLARIAQFQETSLARAVGVASKLIEPILMILIGLVIGGIVVLMYLPIFDLASSIQ